jgi:hypothetical protein
MSFQEALKLRNHPRESGSKDNFTLLAVSWFLRLILQPELQVGARLMLEETEGNARS